METQIHEIIHNKLLKTSTITIIITTLLKKEIVKTINFIWEKSENFLNFVFKIYLEDLQ